MRKKADVRMRRLGICLFLIGLLCMACGSPSSDSGETEQMGGLVYTGSMELEYAANFSVDEYEGGYRLITLMDGSQYLLVPEGAAVPAVEEPVTILQQPLDRTYLVASAAMDFFRELDAIDCVRFSGQKAEGWYIPEAAAAMEAGEMIYAGKYSMPDYELILSGECDLAIENTMVTHSPEVVEKLEEFGIPVLIDYSSYESHPLGRVEWIRLYGTLLGKEEEADAAFERQTEILEQLSGEVPTGKTVAFFYLATNGTVKVRRTGDYIPKLIGLAGGTYVFSDLGDDDARSTVNLTMEEFYATAKNADILIYNSTVDGELDDLDALLEKSPLLADFKAVEDGQVWCTGADFYQHTMAAGDFLEDLHGIFTGDEDRDYAYVYRL